MDAVGAHRPAPAAAAIELRAVDPPADADLLLAIYAATRTEELAVVPWTEAEKAAFLGMQFAAQDRYWRELRPDASYDVIVVDGQPAGRLYVDRLATEIRIVDIALLPDHRGMGVGTQLIRRILDEAGQTRRPVTIHVERGNRARALYERLGFSQISTTGVYDLYERPPDRSPPSHVNGDDG